MKHLLKLTFIASFLTLAFTAGAQEVIAAPANGGQPEIAQDTTKKAVAPAPAKPQPAPSEGAKKEDTAPGGSKMAINEQGVPSKGKKKAKATTTTAPPSSEPKK